MPEILYSGNEFVSSEDVNKMGIENMAAFGIYPVVDVLPARLATEGFAVKSIDLVGNVYQRTYNTYHYSCDILRGNLSVQKIEMQERFKPAFAEIDARQSRPDRGIILALVDGTFPKEDTPGLTPEQQQRITDVGIMWELEEIAQANRDMQTELLALEITEDMTLEEAQEITLRIANAKPWLPWEQQATSEA